MSHNLKPVTGQWYRHLDKGQTFRVVSVERDKDLVEMQHFDGDLEELGFAEWFAMDLGEAAEPEDWTGPIDDVETDDLGFSETAMSKPDWRASLDANKEAGEKWEDETPEDERDKRGEGEPSEETTDVEP